MLFLAGRTVIMSLLKDVMYNSILLFIIIKF